MKAKRTITAALSLMAALTLTTIVTASCQKTALETMSGSYTYKTSGMVGLVPTQLIGTGLPMDTTWVALTPEQGQMNIVTKNSDDNIMIVTWNDLLGNACSTEAKLDDKTLTLTPNTKTATLTDGTNTLGGGFVKFAGEGTLYDNMLIIPMIYQGTFSLTVSTASSAGATTTVQMTVAASKVECIAKAN